MSGTACSHVIASHVLVLTVSGYSTHCHGVQGWVGLFIQPTDSVSKKKLLQNGESLRDNYMVV